MSFIHSFLSKVRDSLAASVHNRLYYDQRVQYLLHETLNSQKMGVTSEKIAEEEVIVSLTTHGRRIYEAYLAIESIMQGSVLPNKIVLWLSTDFEHQELPLSLKRQCSRGLEIYFTEDIGPYTKLIPSLLKFPEASIITVDDDVLYPFDTVEMLLNSHNTQPSCICANQVIDVRFNSKGELATFPSWKQLMDKTRISERNFFEGLAGVLYPPRCFPSEVFDKNVFRDICPTADDIWFNCVALKNKTKIVPANHHYLRFPLVFNDSVQDMGLWRINNEPRTCPHDKQLKAVLEHFKVSYAH